MEVVNCHLQSPMYPQFMNKLSSTYTRSTTRTAFHLFAPSFSTTTATSAAASDILTKPPKPIKSPPKRKASTKVKITNKALVGLHREEWLNSLSCPTSTSSESETDPASEWVLGVDPDAHGALAVIRPDRSVEVFDAPNIKVPVGKTLRTRLDAKSIVKLVRSFNAPIGTSVYVEQASPFSTDGKQGWWCMGFGYGMWVGILVASGFSVVPVSSMSWKSEFQLPGHRDRKDAGRELASALFPSMSPRLTRKKDHGRAEALLIAAYGKGLKLMEAESKLL